MLTFNVVLYNYMLEIVRIVDVKLKNLGGKRWVIFAHFHFTPELPPNRLTSYKEFSVFHP